MAVKTRWQSKEMDPVKGSQQEEKGVMDTSDDDGTESSFSQASSSGEEPATPTLDFRSATEWANFVAGVCLLALAGPPVGVVVFAAMIWEAIDRGFDGGFVDSGRELTGFLFAKAIPWLRESTQKFNERFVKRSDDAYMMNCIVAYGVMVPMMFFGCAYIAFHSENRMTPLWVLFVYHLVRIGPYFMNFAYVSRWYFSEYSVWVANALTKSRPFSCDFNVLTLFFFSHDRSSGIHSLPQGGALLCRTLFQGIQ